MNGAIEASVRSKWCKMIDNNTNNPHRPFYRCVMPIVDMGLCVTLLADSWKLAQVKLAFH